MSWLLIGSISLNVVLSGYLIKWCYNRKISHHFNSSISDVAKKVISEGVARYERYSDEHSEQYSNRVDVVNRITRQIFPELILPRQAVEQTTRCQRLIEYLTTIISPFDIYSRYRSTPMEEDLREWLTGIRGRIGQIDLDEFISQVFPNILRQILFGHTPISYYYIRCQYRHLPLLKYADIDLDDEELENVEDAYVAICLCGHLEVNKLQCSSCDSEIRQRVDYETFIGVREAISLTALTQCPITLNDFTPETEIGVLSCGHYGEREPLTNWIQNTYRCHYAQCQLKPLQIPAEEEDEDDEDEEEEEYGDLEEENENENSLDLALDASKSEIE